MSTTPAPRSGVGDPPKGCTCTLSQYMSNRIGPDFGKRVWHVYIADDKCPAHRPEAIEAWNRRGTDE